MNGGEIKRQQSVARENMDIKVNCDFVTSRFPSEPDATDHVLTLCILMVNAKEEFNFL